MTREKTFVILTKDNTILEIVFETISGDEVATVYSNREVAMKAISLMSDEDREAVGPLRIIEQIQA